MLTCRLLLLSQARREAQGKRPATAPAIRVPKEKRLTRDMYLQVRLLWHSSCVLLIAAARHLFTISPSLSQWVIRKLTLKAKVSLPQLASGAFVL